MERRLGLVAAIIVGGFASASALAIATGACHDNLYAHWLARSGSGPPVPLSPACAPSYLANAYALEFVYLVGAVALVAGIIALGFSIAGRLTNTPRIARARQIIGWFNVAALTLVMVAITAVAGCGEGEVQFFAVPGAGVGFVASLLGSFTGSRTSAPLARAP